MHDKSKIQDDTYVKLDNKKDINRRQHENQQKLKKILNKEIEKKYQTTKQIWETIKHGSK